MKKLRFFNGLGVISLFLVIAALVSTEIIVRYVTLSLSDWSRTFLICVLVWWLMLDNYTFAVDLHTALISHRRLSDEMVISYHRIHALKTSALLDEPNRNTPSDDKNHLTLELLHWNLLFSKASVMYYIRCMRVVAQGKKPKPVVPLSRGRSRSLSPGRITRTNTF
jgi:hypothetical protein